VKRAVANQEEEGANDDAGANLRPSGAETLGPAPDEEDQAGDQVADACGVERRNGFHGEADS